MSDDQVYYAIRYTIGEDKGKFVCMGVIGQIYPVKLFTDATAWCSKDCMKDLFFSKRLPKDEFELVKIKLTIEPVVLE